MFLCAAMSSLILGKLHELFMVHEKLNSHIFCKGFYPVMGDIVVAQNPLILTANFSRVSTMRKYFKGHT